MSTLTSVSGFPRIGQNRELKKIIEGYWKGANDLAALKATAAELRAKHWKLQQAAGIDLIPATTSATTIRCWTPPSFST